MAADILDLADRLGRGALPGGEDGLRLAAHLAELAWLAWLADPGIQRARQQVYSIRADRATSTMATGVYRWAASESLDAASSLQSGQESS